MNEVLEVVAKDYLRPHCEAHKSPYEIMKLPPEDFQGWHVEIKAEVIRLSQDGEVHELSLKKVIVKVDMERGLFGRPYPPTPREMAKLLISFAIGKHQCVEDLARGGRGIGWYGYNASIGGFIKRPGMAPKWSGCWQIVVTEFQGDECCHVFGLREIYDEVNRERKQGFAVVQSSLFS